MKAGSLLLLRIALGLLLVLWGVDKLIRVEHGMAVANHFYFGVSASVALLKVFGALEVLIGIAVILGVLRRIAYPLQLLLNAITVLAVWRSVLDPWGWYLHDTNVLFYPSLIVFAASWVLWAFIDADRLSLDMRGRRAKMA
ncbi:MAG: DoxX family membrane protein [Rhodanobacteraceae bacterium]